MTDLVSAVATVPTTGPAPGPDATDPQTKAAQGTSRSKLPFRAHVVLLGVILLAAIPFIDNGSIGNPDEAAALAQATLITPDSDWVSPYWATEFDPSGRWLPLENSTPSDTGFLPYSKRPAYPAVIAPFLRNGGTAGVLGLHVLATLAAAAIIAMIAARFDPKLATPTLWLAGIGSPLLFDSYQAIAHSLATAFAAGATLLVVGAVAGAVVGAVVGAVPAASERPTDRSFIARSMGAVLCLTAAGALRTEGLMFAAALGVAVLTVMFGFRGNLDRPWRLAVLAVGLAAAGGAAHVGSALWEQRLVGAQRVTPFRISNSGNWLTTRVAGLQRTLLTADSPGSLWSGLAATAAAFLLIWSAVLIRRGGTTNSNGRWIAITAVGGAAFSLVRIFGDRGAIPGLVFAAPVVIVGLVLFVPPRSARQAPRPTARPTAQLLVVATGVHMTLVALTQYKSGGSGEWGWRYVHIALPALLPLAAVGLASLPSLVDRRTARIIRSAWIVAAVGSAALALLVQREDRLAPALLVAATDRAVSANVEVDADGTIIEPPVIANSPGEGRYLWQGALSGRHLLVTNPAELPAAVSASLQGPDTTSVILIVKNDPARTIARLRDRGHTVTQLDRIDRSNVTLYLVR